MRVKYFIMMEIEICCNSIQSALNALRGGATRIELCHDLEGGGVTPSAGAISYCTNELGLRTRVLIRPRRGDFVYSDAEFEVIRRDVLLCKELGAEAVVVGFLTPDGKIDIERTCEIVQLAAPMEVTFHRAFDELAPEAAPEALEQVIACGCHKLLTSGCAPTAIEGAEVIKALVDQADGRIGIIAASGVTPDTLPDILARTHVREAHGSCKMNTPNGIVTDEVHVKKLIEIQR